MRASWGAMAVALALAAPVAVAAQDHARPRDGGSSGGSSSAGENHHSSSSSSSGSVQSESSSSSRDSSSDSSSNSDRGLTEAQRRHPRPGTGTGDRYYGRNGGGYGSYAYPYYYGYRNPSFGLYYDPFWYGYYGYSPYYYGGSYGYGSYGYAPYRYRSSSRDSGSLRVIVDPERARVYVDGYYAGIADDFDGIFQRLYLPPGRHEIMLKLEGYETHRYKVYVPVDQTIKIHHVMVRGSGETEDVVGSPLDDDRDARWSDRGRYGDDRDRVEDRDRGRPGRDGREGEDERDNAEAGTLRLDVRPPDASIYVDGQFRGPARQADRLRLAPGSHRIEVVRPGYRTVERDVEVRPGELKDLEVELSR